MNQALHHSSPHADPVAWHYTTKSKKPSHRTNATIECTMPNHSKRKALSVSLNQQRKHAIEGFFNSINKKDLEGVRALLSDDFVLVERGRHQDDIKSIMAVEETMASLQALMEAVPDLCMKHGSIEENNPQKEQNTMVVHDYTSVGTHTGKALDLFDLPIIEPSGETFALDNCDIYFTFAPGSHLIARLEEVELEETTGLSGVYNVLRHLDSIGL